VGRAHARIHVEHDASRRTAVMNMINPMAGKIAESWKVLSRSERLRLEATHLARWRCATMSRLAADNPAHRRIMPQTLSVIHILVSSEVTKYRLPA
jgi:hypothetical protein